MMTCSIPGSLHLLLRSIAVVTLVMRFELENMPCTAEQEYLGECIPMFSYSILFI
jgi:hypothetical protein